VAVALRRSGLLLARNVLFTGLRIPLLFLPVLIRGTHNHILTAWSASAVISVAFSTFWCRRIRGEHSMRPLFGHLVADIRDMSASLLGQHVVTVASNVTSFVLPIIVLARLSESDGAYFYATWMLGAVFFMISPCIAMALFAETATDPEDIPGLARRCSRIIAALLGPLILVYLIGGGWVLRVFGESYSAHGQLLLIVLTLSAIPDAVTNIAVAVLRAVGRLREAMTLNVSMLLTCLALSWILLPSMGIVAVGISWIVAQSLGALWALGRWRYIVVPARPRVLR
jgi:O-antigen/teichoic acid export membrane protein